MAGSICKIEPAIQSGGQNEHSPSDVWQDNGIGSDFMFSKIIAAAKLDYLFDTPKVLMQKS